MTAAKESQNDSVKKFQGIGLVYGRVEIDHQGKVTLYIEEEKFQLICYNHLKKRIIKKLDKNPEGYFYFRVYPQFSLATKTIRFQAVNFYQEKHKKTQVNHFLIAGVWQYLPKLLDVPVLSIYRNSLLSWEKGNRIKANHIPIKGFEEEPYSYNSKNNQTPRKFYELSVRFNPQQREFQFLLLLDSSDKIPRYLTKKTFNKNHKKPQKSSKKKT